MKNSRQIRITESQLRQIIEQSVRNILSEGKFSNNVPRFADKRGNDVLKGQYASATTIDKKYGKSNWDLFDDALKNGGEDWKKSKESTEAWSKHNNRIWADSDDKLALKKKDEVLNMQNNKREWAEYLSKFGLTLDDVFNMPPEEFAKIAKDFYQN